MYVSKKLTKTGTYSFYGNKGKRISKEKYYKQLQFNKYEKISKENKQRLTKTTYNKIEKAAKKNHTSVKKEFQKVWVTKRKSKISYIKNTYDVNTGTASEILKAAIETGRNYKTTKELLEIEGMNYITSYFPLKIDLTENLSEIFKNGSDAQIIIDCIYKYSGPASDIGWPAFRQAFEYAMLRDITAHPNSPEFTQIEYPIMSDIINFTLNDMEGDATAAKVTLKDGVIFI